MTTQGVSRSLRGQQVGHVTVRGVSRSVSIPVTRMASMAPAARLRCRSRRRRGGAGGAGQRAGGSARLAGSFTGSAGSSSTSSTELPWSNGESSSPPESEGTSEEDSLAVRMSRFLVKGPGCDDPQCVLTLTGSFG